MMPVALQQSPLLARRERLWPVVLVSLAAHAAGLGWLLFHPVPPEIQLEQKPIVAKLVRLGEKRPEQWLPRKEQELPAPAAAPAPVPVPAPAPAAPAAPAPQVALTPPARPAPPRPSAAARGGGTRTDVLASVLSKVKRDQALNEPVWGDPGGHPEGTASEASEGDTYGALVEIEIRRNYVLPSTLSEADRVRLRATVVLYVDDSGDVLRHSFLSRSGNAAFDAAIERAVLATQRLPPPPAERRRSVRVDGIAVNFSP